MGRFERSTVQALQKIRPRPWIAQSDPWYGKAVGKSWREAAAVMRIEWQIGFWIGAFLLLVLLLWPFQRRASAFRRRLRACYLLNPVVDRLERLGFNRLGATLFIMACFVLVLISISFDSTHCLAPACKFHRGVAGICRQAGGTDFGRDRGASTRLRGSLDGQVRPRR